MRGRPPTLFAGYWELSGGDEVRVPRRLVPDRRRRARRTTTGYFTFVGRAEDVITSGGRTFGPYDVERVLAGHAAIAATAVVGIRDLQRGGHFVRAFVVPRGAKRRDRSSSRPSFASSSRRRSPNQQVPREIVFVDELPTVGWQGEPPRAARAAARRATAVGDAADDRARGGRRPRRRRRSTASSRRGRVLEPAGRARHRGASRRRARAAPSRDRSQSPIEPS